MIAGGWLIWLALFLAYEIPAAVAEVVYDRRGKPRAITLSRNVWRWVGLARGQEWRPYRRLRQAAVFVFLQALAFHLPFGWPGGAVIALTAIPVGVVIAYAAFVEDRRERRSADIERRVGAIQEQARERARARWRHAEHVRADASKGGQ